MSVCPPLRGQGYELSLLHTRGGDAFDALAFVYVGKTRRVTQEVLSSTTTTLRSRKKTENAQKANKRMRPPRCGGSAHCILLARAVPVATPPAPAHRPAREPSSHERESLVA